MSTLEQTYDRFRTTRWTEIRALGQADEVSRQKALDALVTRYWPAVYAHLRAQGESRNAAAELTQAFFAEVVLERGLFDRASQERGRLRTLLLTALRRFRIDQHRRRTARGTNVTIPLERLLDEDAKLGLREPASPEGRGRAADPDSFERRWALGLLEEALRRCEAHFRTGGRERHWQLFEARVLRPAATENEPEPLATLAGSLGFDSAALAAAAVQVVKRRTAALLREVVAETLDDEADVDAELAEARRYLSI